MKLLLSGLCSLLLATPLLAAIEGRDVEYKAGDTLCQGYMAADAAAKGPRPAVLVIHDWMGVTDRTREKCQEIAKLGYVAFAPDIYGKGVRPADSKAASGQAGQYKTDRKLLRERAAAGLAELQKVPGVAKEKIAAIGFCFGGTTALELGRAGAELAGIVSFHGGLDSPNPQDGKNFKAKVLVLHGADDPFVKEPDIKAFISELNTGKVDWQMISYGDAVHSFSEPAAGTDKSKGAAYNEKAARRSWQAMQDFFGEIFQ
jgi:dienelactone hydrolase